jgi:hypothetical protein
MIRLPVVPEVGPELVDPEAPAAELVEAAVFFDEESATGTETATATPTSTDNEITIIFVRPEQVGRRRVEFREVREDVLEELRLYVGRWSVE